MRTMITILLLLGNGIISFAQSFSLSGKVLDKAKMPIIGASATIIGSSNETNLRKGAITLESGEFQLENIPQGRYSLEVSCLGYSKYLQEIVLDKSVHIGEVILEEMSFGLEDVVITAQSVERFADRKEYKLTNAEKAQYSSALSALEFLPKIQVLDQDVTTIDGKSVKILINGVPSTPIELSSIAPNNIAKIDYYTQPPVQYSNMGLGAVINVITKKNENGGSVGINTQNAVTTGFGNNLVNLKYNFGRSQV
ncbi:MAG: carboxypeptidase-like regulatory domain-containing protein, partial [Tannerellaceae bacterium]